VSVMQSSLNRFIAAIPKSGTQWLYADPLPFLRETTSMDAPMLRYARLDGVSLAFQTVGSEVELLVIGGSAGMSATWTEPTASEILWEISRFTRLVTFDQRGAGLSDPLPGGHPLPLEERVRDAFAVFEAADLDRPFVLATHDGGPVALLAVTTQPDRFRGLILVSTAPCLRRAPDYPAGFDDATADWFPEQMRANWGTGWSVDFLASSFAAMPGGRERWARLEQAACSPGQARAQTEQAFATDVRHLLEIVSVPTLVIERRDDPAIPRGSGRYMADRIPDAWLVELPGSDHMPWSGDGTQIADAIRWFVAHEAPPEVDPRKLAAVVFTDIVRSTEQLADLGDSRWAAILDLHDAAARNIAEADGGQLIKSTGDGTLCLFRGPAQAIHYAMKLKAEVGRLGLEMRAGVHAGEVHTRGGDVTGIAVHAAARVSAVAPEGKVFVSRTVTDLVAGSDLEFVSEGEHSLKGLPGNWELFSVTE
jgi:pimeloyl-ACP methyl ester carboxylesterase